MQIETMIPPPQLAAPTDRDPLTSRIRPGTMLAILVVGAVLHFGSEVFLPLEIGRASCRERV